MSDSAQATYGIAITGSDQTAKAAKSAERRLGQIPKHAGIANRRFAQEGERSLRRHSRAVLRTFGEVEQAGARIFGGRSITSGIAGRLGAVRAAGAAAGTGLGEAAASGGVLSGAMGAVGVAVGATIGILASAAYAAVAMANGWAKGAASIGRTSEIIGVGTKALQEFSAAAERVGVDKDKATGTLGNLSQTLNDAKYGRNPAAMAVLGRLGVAMKTNADGTVDVAGMLPAIADAIARQNSSGRRTAAQHLGIGLDALPAFTQGGKALSADMADASVHANVLTDEQIGTGKRIARKGAIVGQMKDRALGAAGAATAGVLEQGYDATIRGGQAILDGARDFGGTVERTFKPAAEKIERGAQKLDQAADRIGRAIAGQGAGRFTAGQISALAKKAMPLREEAMRYGFSSAEATGIAANVMLESGGRHKARERGNSGAGRGLIQWTDPARKAEFKRVMGVDVDNASRDQQWKFLRYELSHKEARNWQRALGNGQDAASIAAGYARHVERPLHKDRDSAERAAVAEAMVINLQVSGLPAGSSVKATGGRGAKPAVSHAMAH